MYIFVYVNYYILLYSRFFICLNKIKHENITKKEEANL